MRVLVSAYACDPHRGSEPGVGWNWTLEIARRGHEVWIVTREKNAPLIEAVAAQGDESIDLHVIPYDLPRWARWWKGTPGGVYLYYALWQWGAYRAARFQHAKTPFDVVHHLTFGTFRTPGFMWRLGVPLIFGPVGGAESAPPALRRTFGWSERLIDWFREVGNHVALCDPNLWCYLRHAHRVYACTEETRRFLPRRYHDKIEVEPSIGADRPPPGEQRAMEPTGPLRLLFVGRLVYWKGLHLGLQALARARAMESQIELTVLGRGREEAALHRLAASLGISESIRWLGNVDFPKVDALYRSSHALLFPSLHESGGLVVLEAMARGVPVLCLKLGGPAIQVTRERGCAVSVPGWNPDGVIDEMADVMTHWARHRMELEPLRHAARTYSISQLWSAKVARVYSALEDELALPVGDDTRQATGC